MKKLLFFCSILPFLKLNAQVVFCPPGAEWRYEFTNGMFSPLERINEKIFYYGDSISGAETFKVLAHNKFFRQCNMSSPAPTLIKQKGDTIYFKNSRTQNSWQILYNFACTVGQNWQTTVLQKNGNPITYTYVVDSVTYITINGFNLKRLKITDPVSGSIYVTERFGSAQFLFNFNNSGIGSCDGDYFQSFLCYTDNSFGTKIFGAKPCDFSNLTGIITRDLKGNEVSLYPNPTTGLLNLEVENEISNGDFEARLLNAIGLEVMLANPSVLGRNITIDLTPVPCGIYFVQIFQNGKLLGTKKIVKG